MASSHAGRGRNFLFGFRMSTRVALSVLACAALGVLGSHSVTTTSTEAAWNDPEVASASFTARQIPALLQDYNCDYTAGLLVPDVIYIYWQLPPNADGLNLSNVVITQNGAAPSAPLSALKFEHGVVTTALPLVSAGSYVTAINSTFSKNLLDKVYGTTIVYDLYLTMGPVNLTNWSTSVWKSPPLRATAVLGTNAIRSCTVSFPTL